MDALTVDLDFIVGRVAKTVSELSALAAGQTIPLDALTSTPVRIVAHGTELGTGQLVEREGGIAVEILTWGNPR
ncbi:FliM/FliN family flagellar motor switch protein [Roseateles chitinivorans]|uniref:FliM/FliN family flagellar motor switch protein n=1 Tax=Roseateles chitinivorans TaxID=2917965 RepID=UPI003D66AD74